MKHYTQLKIKERRQISAFLLMGLPVYKIAIRLKRHRSTIYREINRNSQQRGYMPVQAHQKANERKHRKPSKLYVNSTLYKYVLSKLKAGWSPEQISGRLKAGNHSATISHESIYQYIYRHAQSKLFYYLPTQNKKRRARFKRKHRQQFNGIRAYKNRPFTPCDRRDLGHWEGDTIRFKRERQLSITTLVERKSRLLLMCKNERSLSKIVMTNILKRTHFLPNKMCKTITFDQGSEFAHCQQLERQRKCQVYYADVSSPWQRGTNENTNRRIRRYLPKNIKIRELSDFQLQLIENNFNNTPRKCLGFLTPFEVFYGIK